ncbi:MAG: transposase, partial [Oscillospiraceae bacterium]|nr:transposase [Oscillospiraceae bacterium]
MYLDILVKIPEIEGKITKQKKESGVYIDYEYHRDYLPDRKYTIPKRVSIGKQCVDDETMMRPNQNYLIYFPDIDLPEEKNQERRSSCLRAGAYIVIKKIMEMYRLPEMLEKYLGEKDTGLFLDLAAYSIISENNAGQYYPDYAYNHPLFTEGMRIYSDSKVSDFLYKLKEESSVGFLNEWNSSRDHNERIYISYDSTNKTCQAGNIEMVEYGHTKDDSELPVFNYSIAYDINNREPLFYEDYPVSIVDVSQLQYMLEKSKAYGYERIGFILDRGYFSKDNIRYMDALEYDFVIMVKGMANFVREIIIEHKGKFENSRENIIREYKAYGMTIKQQLFASDEKDRYFHIFYNSSREYSEREIIEANIERMTKYLTKQQGKVCTLGDGYKKYFELFIDEKDNVLVFAKEKAAIIEKEIDLCGYFVIVTSQEMTAKEALNLYKSRDTSEKLFRGDKSYLGNKSLRVHSNESAASKIFIEFVALIIRSKMYTVLKDEMTKNDSKSNYMTVPAAIKELEKIELVKLLD